MVLESLAMRYGYVVKRVEDLAGKRIRKINIASVGSRNRLHNQLTADFDSRPVTLT